MDTAMQETVIKAVEILTPKEGDVLIFKVGRISQSVFEELNEAISHIFAGKSINAIVIPQEIDVVVVREGEQ